MYTEIVNILSLNIKLHFPQAKVANSRKKAWKYVIYSNNSLGISILSYLLLSFIWNTSVCICHHPHSDSISTPVNIYKYLKLWRVATHRAGSSLTSTSTPHVPYKYIGTRSTRTLFVRMRKHNVQPCPEYVKSMTQYLKVYHHHSPVAAAALAVDVQVATCTAVIRINK